MGLIPMGCGTLFSKLHCNLLAFSLLTIDGEFGRGDEWNGSQGSLRLEEEARFYRPF